MASGFPTPSDALHPSSSSSVLVHRAEICYPKRLQSAKIPPPGPKITTVEKPHDPVRPRELDFLLVAPLTGTSPPWGTWVAGREGREDDGMVASQVSSSCSSTWTALTIPPSGNPLPFSSYDPLLSSLPFVCRRRLRCRTDCPLPLRRKIRLHRPQSTTIIP